MDEKPDQIMNHIDTQRQELGRNLNELEHRVKGATDWRVQFDKNPLMMMGVALGGGLLLGTMVAGKRSSNRSSYGSSSRNYGSSSARSAGAGAAAYGASSSAYGGSQGLSSAGSSSSSAETSPALREQKRKATDTLEHMKAALVGFAIAKVKEFMTEALPGFDHHLSDAEQKNANRQGGGSSSSSSPYGSGGNQGHDQSGGQTSGGSSYASTGNQASTRDSSSFGQQHGHDQQNQPVGANPGSNI